MTINEKSHFLARFMAGVGEVCGKYQAYLDQALAASTPLPDALTITHEYDGYMGHTSMSIVGDPGAGICELTLTTDHPPNIEAMIGLMHGGYYTKERVIRREVDRKAGILKVLFYLAPKEDLDRYQMLKSA